MSSILTVSQLNRYISFKIKSDVKLQGIAVKGEISNLNINYNSGHAYFSLRDNESVVKAVMFRGNLSKVKFNLENGMNVVAFGNIDVYERDGVYQIIANDISPVGVGAVQVSYEQLKAKLSAMGVFDLSIKRKIEANPQKIAVVTSSAGAAVQDIINVISRRYPICKIKVFSTLVQGKDAPEMISRTLFEADREDADTIILARGGGSSEDLQAFNTEKVVLAIYNCSTPVISAVGHETDTTLADYAADVRVPTPSAAAEIAVPDMKSIYVELDRLVYSAKLLCLKQISAAENKLSASEKKLSELSPHRTVDKKLSEIENVKLKLDAAFTISVERRDKRLLELTSKLSALNPFSVMERGYSVVLKNGETVTSCDGIHIKDSIDIRFLNGSIKAEVTEIYSEE